VTFLRTTGNISEPRHGTIKLPWLDRPHTLTNVRAERTRRSGRARACIRSCRAATRWPSTIAGSRAEVEELTGSRAGTSRFRTATRGGVSWTSSDAAGYLSARTIEPGWVEPATDPYRLKSCHFPILHCRAPCRRSPRSRSRGRCSLVACCGERWDELDLGPHSSHVEAVTDLLVEPASPSAQPSGCGPSPSTARSRSTGPRRRAGSVRLWPSRGDR
jgi:hypothetical protein